MTIPLNHPTRPKSHLLWSQITNMILLFGHFWHGFDPISYHPWGSSTTIFCNYIMFFYFLYSNMKNALIPHMEIWMSECLFLLYIFCSNLKGNQHSNLYHRSDPEPVCANKSAEEMLRTEANKVWWTGGNNLLGSILVWQQHWIDLARNKLVELLINSDPWDPCKSALHSVLKFVECYLPIQKCNNQM